MKKTSSQQKPKRIYKDPLGGKICKTCPYNPDYLVNAARALLVKDPQRPDAADLKNFPMRLMHKRCINCFNRILDKEEDNLNKNKN